MISVLRRRLRSRDDEGGYVLPVVMAVGILMLVLVATSLSVAGTGYRKAGTDVDGNAALAAAYGGLAEYQSRLANDSSYTKYGNPQAPFTVAARGSDVALPQVTNPAFDISAVGAWAPVPGSDGRATFRYEVDNSTYASTGALRVRVTGKVNQETRSVVADLRQNGFLNYVYLTDLETTDPSLTNNSPGGNDNACVKLHRWEGRSSGCTAIQFNNDNLTGPVRSNDSILACNTTFSQQVLTADPSGAVYDQCGSNSNRFLAGPPQRADTIGIPESNSEMKKETRSDLASVPQPGCLYTGPTSITYNGNGTMTIQSPWTKFTTTTGGNSGGTPSRCGSISALGSAAGATIPVLANNVAYVQNVPAAGSGDPNAWNGNSSPQGFKCTTQNGMQAWSYESTRYPAVDETKPLQLRSSIEPYGCRNGDVFVKGTVKGATTLAAENFVYITGNLTYSDRTTDLLGLVGNNAVWVWNPVKTDQNGNRSLMDTSSGRTVNAAIMSVQHTFGVQNYDVGPSRGTLTVLGSIAQKFRGTVAMSSNGWLSSGFSKNYVYDERLKSASPPRFITPVSTTYNTLRVGGVSPAFKADGSAN